MTPTQPHSDDYLTPAADYTIGSDGVLRYAGSVVRFSMTEPTHDEIHQAIEEWADDDQGVLLAHWLMQRFGWTLERAEGWLDGNR